MRRIELGHWFVGDNELSISLLRFYVKISICQKNEYHLIVVDQNQTIHSFTFSSLQDAIDFTELTVQNCLSLENIIEIFQERQENNKILCKARDI